LLAGLEGRQIGAAVAVDAGHGVAEARLEQLPGGGGVVVDDAAGGVLEAIAPDHLPLDPRLGGVAAEELAAHRDRGVDLDPVAVVDDEGRPLVPGGAVGGVDVAGAVPVPGAGDRVGLIAPGGVDLAESAPGAVRRVP